MNQKFTAQPGWLTPERITLMILFLFLFFKVSQKHTVQPGYLDSQTNDSYDLIIIIITHTKIFVIRSVKAPKSLRGSVKLREQLNYDTLLSTESDFVEREYVVVEVEDAEDERYCPTVIRLAVSVRVRAEREGEESWSALADQGKEK